MNVSSQQQTTPPYPLQQPFRVAPSRKHVQGAVYEDLIVPVQPKLMKVEDRKTIAFLLMMLTLSLGFKFMLLFDAFPPLITWLMGLILMGSFTLFYFLWFRLSFRDYGFSVDFSSTRFDLLASLVLSTFFISYMGLTVKEDEENSTLKEPSVILVRNFDQKKFKEPQISKKEYYYRVAYPNVKRGFLTLALIIGFIINFISGTFSPAILVSLKLFSNFLAMYILVEIFPGIGRDKFLMQYLSSWQALLLFLASSLLFVFTMGVDVITSLNLIF